MTHGEQLWNIISSLFLSLFLRRKHSNNHRSTGIKVSSDIKYNSDQNRENLFKKWLHASNKDCNYIVSPAGDLKNTFVQNTLIHSGMKHMKSLWASHWIIPSTWFFLTIPWIYIWMHLWPSLWNPGLSLKIKLWDNKHQSWILTINFTIISIFDMALLHQY